MTELGPIYISNSERMHVRILAAWIARGLRFVSPSKIEEGAGKAGCALHPRSRVQVCAKESAHEHTGEAEALRLSLRGGLTAYFVLSSVNGLSCHRRPAGLHLQSLAPASRRQDHTTSPYASAALVSHSSRVHRIPPRVRDDRDPPLSSGGARGE